MKKVFFILTLLVMIFSFSTAEAAGYLNSINVMKSAYNTVINISLSEPTKFSEGKLTDTKKIYIDFKNTIISQPYQEIVGTNFVNMVRSAQNTTNPEYITRVVFDMEKITDYKIQTYDNKTISIVFEEVNDSPKAVTDVTVVTEPTVTTEPTTATLSNDTTSRGSITRPASENIVRKDKLIVVDAGHGGKDPGAIFDLVEEKRLNLDIAKRLRKLLEAEGYQVIMTRTTDEFVELVERADIANRNNADLFISVHNNSMPEGFSGTMTLYSTRDVNNKFSSKDLAEAVQKSNEASLKNGAIGARERDNLVVLNKTTMPAIIAEIACMSDKTDLALLKTADFRQAAAQGICNAVLSLDF